jgi:chromosome segregation ATPase
VQPHTQKVSAGAKSEIVQLQAKIEDYKRERGNLRVKLDSFRKQFEQQYNRKIKFKRDIKDVEGEFKRYKDLKDDIGRLEKQLALKTNNSG